MYYRDCRSALISLLVLAATIPAEAQLGTGEFITRLIDHDGYVRTYNLYVPASYDGSKEWPLVIGFHGWSQSPGSYQVMEGLSAVADTAGFLVAYLHGLPISICYGTARGWNVDGSFGDWDDVAFANRMIDLIDNDYAIDLRRVHTTGFSFGGMMSFATACQLGNRVASIGAVAGPMMEKFFVEGCPTNRPLSVLQFHGTADSPWHPYTGITCDPYAPRPVPETLSWWARHNGCSADSIITELADSDLGDNSTVTRVAYPNCDGGTEVVHYRIEGGGHSWPGHGGVGVINMDIDATALIWDFLSRHYMPHGTKRLAVDVEMVHELANLTGRHVGLLGSHHPLDWQRPYRLYSRTGGDMYGASIAFPDTVDGPIVYRFVHYAQDGSDMVEETITRSADLTAAVRVEPVVFWNNENEQPPDLPIVNNPPDGGVTLASVDLEWSAGTVSGRFDVEVDQDQNFGAPLLVRPDIRDYTRLRLSDLDTLATYFWRVRARNAIGVSPWAGPWSFRTVGQAPILRSPEDATVVSEDTNYVRLEWEPYPEKLSYQLSVSTHPDFSESEEFSVRGGQTTYDYGPVASLTTYYWRVRWFNGPWSPTWEFTTPAIIGVDEVGITTGFRLSQNYPNPITRETMISFALPHTVHVTLTVYDVLARQVGELASGMKPAGTNEVSFDAADLPSGVYLYRLRAGDYVKTRRMVVAR